MYVGSFPPISNRADWSTIFLVADEDTGDGIDLTGASIVFEVRDRNTLIAVLSATTTNGKVQIIDTGTINVSFTRDEVSKLRAATYDVGCTVTSNGTIYQTIIATLTVLDGVVTQ